MTRDERMKKRRESGKVYVYKKNPYEKGTKEWVEEENARAEKRRSKKPHYAKMTSVFAKLDNELTRIELAAKKSKEKKAKKEKK